MGRVYSVNRLFRRDTKLDTFYFVYFVLHVFITLLVDSSLVIPSKFQPYFQRQIILFHIESNKDFLLLNPPSWLKFFGWIEILFQLPFFVFGSIALYNRNVTIYPFLTLYGIEASVTTLLCLVSIIIEGPSQGLSSGEVLNLLGVYLPTFIIPFLIFNDILTREWPETIEVTKKEN